MISNPLLSHSRMGENLVNLATSSFPLLSGMSLGTSATQNISCLCASETKGYWRITVELMLLGTSPYLITHSELSHITAAITFIHAPTHLSSCSFTNCHWLSAPCCSTCRLQWLIFYLACGLTMRFHLQDFNFRRKWGFS